MIHGKQGHAPCKTSRSQKSSWQSIFVVAKYPERSGGQNLPTLKRIVQPLTLECITIDCNMMLGLIGALECGQKVCEELRKRTIYVDSLQGMR